MAIQLLDVAILNAIYEHRCLSSDQIYRAITSTGHSPAKSYFRERMSALRKNGHIELQYVRLGDFAQNVYFLTTTGLHRLKEHPLEHSAVTTCKIPACRIKIKEPFIPHQHYLNSFAINLMSILQGIDGVIYRDERHMHISEFVRPDGIIEIPEKTVLINNSEHTIPKTYLYLECDMGTEARKTIYDKFIKYRLHLDSSASDVSARHIILFFCKDDQLSIGDIVSGSVPSNYEESKIMNRRITTLKNEVLKAIGDQIKNNIEVIVGTQPKVLVNLKLRYISEYFGIDPKSLLFNVESVISQYQQSCEIKDVSRLDKFTNGVRYDAYAKSSKYQRAFIFLDYYDANLSVLYKIMHHHSNTRAFRDAMGCDLTLIVTLKKKESIKTISHLCDLKSYDNDDVLFASIDDLKAMPLHKAVFKVTSYGFAGYDETMKTLIPRDRV